jgi:coenzyme F420 biosynthesis associated uncharacterized protein
MPAEAPPMVDWALARSTATRLVKPGPAISADGAAATVAELREAAARAERYVTEVTGLDASSGSAPVLVVDRPGWIQANLDAFRLLLTPLTDLAASRLTSSPRTAGVGARVTGAEVGVLLSYLAPKVLGQFDPFWTGPDGAQGRLLLVAPNVVEETHRVQFTAVPWLRDHMLGLIRRLVDTADFDNGVLAQVVREAVRRIVEGIREGEDLSVIDLVQTPAQRAIVDEITAVMSLLEGHADVVMDSVGPEVVPSVAQIRAKFDVRRQGQGPDKIVRRLLGLDAKMRQYRDGAAFCRHVLDEVGMAGLNRVWTSPDTLPSRAEIANPQLWVIRNHPEPATPAG